jgi:chemotaxis response regulator CheB
MARRNALLYRLPRKKWQRWRARNSVMADSGAYRKVIAVGASAGGVKAIEDFIRALPEDLAVPVVVAMHSDPGSRLAEVIATKCPLPVKRLEDGDLLKNGVVHVVPGATHAFFRGSGMRLSKPVQGSGFRPSIDALFMSLASEYRDKAIAVVLSGNLNDGLRGAQVINDMGGTTVVQDPREAQFTSMPMSVIRRDHPKQILSAHDLGVWVGRFAKSPES